MHLPHLHTPVCQPRRFRRLFNRSISKLALFLASFLFANSYLVSQAQSLPKPPKLVVAGAPVSYFDGERRIDLVLALDELVVETQPGVTVSAVAPRATTAKVEKVEKLAGPTSYRVRFTQQPDRTMLETRAAELETGIPSSKVFAVLYDPTAHKRAQEAARLLRAVAEDGFHPDPGRHVHEDAGLGHRALAGVEFHFDELHSFGDDAAVPKAVGAGILNRVFQIEQ